VVYNQGRCPMAITKIKVSNFKSFDELEVDLRPLNIVVGGNAAGKSNFLEIFRFIRDRSAHGLENAVSLQGGMEYLANLRIGTTKPVSIEVSSEKATYVISFRQNSSSSKVEALEQGVPSLNPNDDRYDLVENLVLRAVSSVAIFDFEPKLAKKAVAITGKADLESDGSNLAIVLRNILQDDDRRENFVRLLKDALPFVDHLKVDRFADRSLLIALKERYSDQSYLPASFLSDGTIHLTALILALYFDKAPVTIIEEPERNIHPHLISKVVGMMKDASRNKQIIATTHNPEVVKNADLEDLLLVQRDEDGFSRISRPAESEELKVFLENDLGVDELYVQDLLGVGRAV
ncbi:MAG TPA: AAA family ATPase, partial [Thermoanaerobaculia bacterium]|nr:AAA family ATPase [Thermoanaerobaculia bacterium]